MTSPAPLLSARCLYLRHPVILHSSTFHLSGSSCALAEPKPTACGHSVSNLSVGAFIIGLCHYRRAQKLQNGELKPVPVLEETRQMDAKNRRGMDREGAI